MRRIFVGDKNVLGFECVINNISINEGRIFMFVNGNKYGQDDFDENIIGFLERQLNSVSEDIEDYDDLFSMEPREFRLYIQCLWSEIDGEFCEQYRIYGYDPFEIDKKLMVRAGYAFDRHFISKIPSAGREKIIVFGENDENGVSIVVEKGKFYCLLKDLYDQLKQGQD